MKRNLKQVLEEMMMSSAFACSNFVGTRRPSKKKKFIKLIKRQIPTK